MLGRRSLVQHRCITGDNGYNGMCFGRYAATY